MITQVVEAETNRGSDAFEEGREAYLEGALYELCPFVTGSQSQHDWQEGWLEEEMIQVASPI